MVEGREHVCLSDTVLSAGFFSHALVRQILGVLGTGSPGRVPAGIALFPLYPNDPLSSGPLHPLEAAGGGFRSCLCCDSLVLPAGSLCAGKASCQRISDQAFYIHPWCDHTSFREEASGMDLG